MYFVNLNIQLKRITNPRLMLLIKKNPRLMRKYKSSPRLKRKVLMEVEIFLL